MRSNLPVTRQEYELPDGETLVSTTDLKSRITYCNDAFVRVSGYSREELMGQPHNVIRHPDMPAEAFRDMWATLQSGQPWSAVVKNRRKNGDHYWVLANATPIVEDGRRVGYMSVRTKPTRSQVEAADALYTRMQAEAGRPVLVLRQGQVLRRGLVGQVRQLMRLGITSRTVSGIAVMGVLAFGFGVWAGTMGLWAARACFGVLAVLTAGAGVWMHGVITRPLLGVLAVANRIAAGDLTQTVSTERRDEVGMLLRTMNQLNVTLQAMVGDVRRQATQIDNASAEIAGGNQDLSARTESQASSLQQTAASIEELSGTVKQNADNAGLASWPAKATRWRCAAARPWPTSCRPWTAYSAPASGSATSSPSSTASLSRPTSWRSMPRWKPHALASMAAVLRWWPAKCARWPSAAPVQRARSSS
jgi:aerotaxis receptor